ncbi:unnamed protein product [Chironomus riparius]|uniref:Uncharacterized protein n=1 Tax=Chironomus riparius TaxID=315576 RepID=A0A9N9WZK3_9DIPT|nr:unnamed protein product [Chironomus riparius]
MEAFKFTIYCCIILQAFAGGPMYIPSSEIPDSFSMLSSSRPACEFCNSVYLYAITPSNAGCDPGSSLAYGVSMIIGSNVFSGVCAGFDQVDFDNAVTNASINSTIDNIAFSHDGETSSYSKP